MAAACLALMGLFFGSAVWAHSSSNSYLTLSMPSQQLTLRADLHLRDLDLIFDLELVEIKGGSLIILPD